ncbi:MAG: SusC/RagA family TonB-linked outer membrane protein [Gemmatimonadota bacterium]|nr:SusC/RagA family TonB-linked outer membrane protein [Gemmatimonadota bacterium]
MRSRLASIAGLVVALCVVPELEAQNRTVTGRVFDVATQQGVPGAVITVAGGTQVTQASEAGEFRIIVPGTDVTLVVRGLGYRRVEVRVPAGQESVNVGMQREALRLTEIVVTGAATTQERRNVGTAVSTVAAEELARVPAVSLDNALQGKIVGANINMNSGAPGGGGQIQIRGVTSILGNAEPLFVVDGVIISNAAFSVGQNSVTRASGSTVTSAQDNPVNRLADVNPNDIESVQVLKSAAATAIYGSKATNGVVIITTKRGRSGAPRFTVSQRVGTYSPLKLLGSRRFTRATLGEVDQAYSTPTFTSNLVGQYCAVPGPDDPCPHFDYQEELFGQRDLSYETSATISGGSEATKYFVSVNDKNDNGTQINTSARRQNLRLNLDQAFGSRWTGNVSATLSRSITNRGLSNNDNTFTSPFYVLAYTPAVQDLQARAAGRYVNNQIIQDLFGIGSNPFQTLEALRNNEDVWRQLASGTLRFSAFSNDQHTVTLQGQGGFDRFDAEGQLYSPNFLQYEDDDGLPGTAVQSEVLSRQINGTVSVIHTFTPAPRFFVPFLSSATTSAGLQYEDRNLNRFNVRAQNLVPTIDLVDQGTPTLFHTKQLVRDQAFFVNEELLAFDERLSLTARVRGERSSVNGDREKFYYWPAASAAYRLTSGIPFTDELKLRAAWGTSGNQANYANNSVVIQSLGIIDSRPALGVPASIGNPAIRPEKMTEQEYGFDALFLNSRVGLEFSYFDRTITELLLTAPLAPSSGFGQQFINGGKLKTDGVEVGLTLTPVRTRDFQWTSRTQYYTFETTIEEIPSTITDFVLGNSGFGASFGRGRIACPRAPGSSRCGSAPNSKPYSATLVWGNRPRGDGTSADTVIGESRPDFQMQFANDFTWKGITINTLVDWRKGGLLSNLTQTLFDEGLNSHDYDKPSPDPSMPLGEWRYAQWNNGRNALPYIGMGTFVKLREITVSYQIPERYLQRFWGRGRDARLMVSGRNLGMWTDYWGVDPEVNNFGTQNVVRFVDLAPYPPNRSYFIGIDFGF